jgi:hypothetical protein
MVVLPALIEIEDISAQVLCHVGKGTQLDQLGPAPDPITLGRAEAVDDDCRGVGDSAELICQVWWRGLQSIDEDRNTVRIVAEPGQRLLMHCEEVTLDSHNLPLLDIWFSSSCKDCLSALQAGLRPMILELVVLGHRGRVLGKNDPRLLRGGEYVNVRRQAVRLQQGSYPYETYGIAGAGIVAPQCYAAGRAASYLLPTAAVRGCQDDLGRTGQQLDTLGLDQCVDDKRRSGLTLAPPAVAAVNEQRPAGQPITD